MKCVFYLNTKSPKYSARNDASTKPTVHLIVEWSVYYVSTNPCSYRMEFSISSISSTTTTTHQIIKWVVMDALVLNHTNIDAKYSIFGDTSTKTWFS